MNSSIPIEMLRADAAGVLLGGLIFMAGAMGVLLFVIKPRPTREAVPTRSSEVNGGRLSLFKPIARSVAYFGAIQARGSSGHENAVTSVALCVRQVLRVLTAPLAVFCLVAQAQPAASRAQFLRDLVAAAIERTHHEVTYDPGYVGITYPGGDVPAGSGVCSDEIVRIYRVLGIDLQKEVHEDIVRDPAAYPLSRWQQKRADRNIDHRRVPNLMVFFSRHGEELRITRHAADYNPGDLVAWDLGNGPVHIGMVVDQKAPATGRFMIVHNIGAGPKMEDVLFDWKIIGHYRYFGPPGVSRAPALPPSR